MIKKFPFLIITLLLTLGLLLVGCASEAADEAVPPAEEDAPAEEAEAPAETGPVYVGALLPLSEPGAPQAGQLILRGIELAAEYVNTELGGSLDGRPVEIVVGDDKGTPEVGATEYRRLVQDYGIVGATGCYHSSVGLATIEVAKELGAPVIMTQASNKAITESGYPQAFRTHLIDPVRAIAMVDFAKSQGYEKVAFIADTTDFGVGLSEAVEGEAAKAGLKVKSMLYDKTSVDLTPELLELEAWGPDIIFNAGTGNAEHIIIDQAFEIGLFPEVPMLATSDWPYRSDEYWELHGEVGTGIYIVTAYHKDMALTPAGQWFYDQYVAEFDEPPTYSSYNGFGDALILAMAAKFAGTTEDYDAIVAALENNEFEFWAGTVTFPRGEGALWHQWTPPVLITQYTEAFQTQDDAQLVYTFNYEPSASEDAPVAAEDLDPVHVGALLPLSEPGAPQAGQLILRGIELAAEYVNTELGGSVDGRPVEIVVGDDKGTPEVGATEYRRLVQEYGIVGATGCYHSSVGLATIEVAKELGAPVIMTQASNKAITESGYPQVFRTHLIDPVRAIAMVDFAKNNGYEKIAFIADTTDFGVGLSEAVENEAEKQGLDVKSMLYDKTSVDLTPELLELQAWGPEIIFNAGTGNAEHIIIDQAYEIGLFPEVPMLATSDWPYRSDEYWELHGEVGAGIYIVTAYHKDMALTPAGQWFYDKYVEEFGESPTYSSYNGFGDALILAMAAKYAGTAEDYDAIVAALENNEFEFWAGTVTFPQGEGALWHQWTPPVLITQYTEAFQTQDDATLVYTFNYTP
jgi:branched-chain amino acid transport system substrate-binding protein